MANISKAGVGKYSSYERKIVEDGVEYVEYASCNNKQEFMLAWRLTESEFKKTGFKFKGFQYSEFTKFRAQEVNKIYRKVPKNIIEIKIEKGTLFK